MNLFLFLPDELIVHISEFLNVESFGNLIVTSKLFSDIITFDNKIHAFFRNYDTKMYTCTCTCFRNTSKVVYHPFYCFDIKLRSLDLFKFIVWMSIENDRNIEKQYEKIYTIKWIKRRLSFFNKTIGNFGYKLLDYIYSFDGELFIEPTKSGSIFPGFIYYNGEYTIPENGIIKVNEKGKCRFIKETFGKYYSLDNERSEGERQIIALFTDGKNINNRNEQQSFYGNVELTLYPEHYQARFIN